MIHEWYNAVRKACGCGELASLQWLLEHPNGKNVYGWIKQHQVHLNLLAFTAGKGHWKIVEYLCQIKIVDELNTPLKAAISNGHTKCVDVLIKVLLAHECYPNFSPVEYAAEHGQLGVVKFLLDFRPDGSIHADAWWSRSRDSLSCAAAGGHLDIVKLMHEIRPQDGKTNAMDRAAGGGHLDVVQWLHANRIERCTAVAMESAVRNGHLDVVKWLHRNGFSYCQQQLRVDG
ncbi:unnamed protein product [Phytophthora fragariaefolia]|uniref:Unnamed protein product n=1 Tax=Phytophthora fragariaefolia TaxID=1490495 RepID=A0A9W6U6H7_9STRA|nr:unnamed protein product [Phytophthora fragariaefolia]